MAFKFKLELRQLDAKTQNSIIHASNMIEALQLQHEADAGLLITSIQHAEGPDDAAALAAQVSALKVLAKIPALVSTMRNFAASLPKNQHATYSRIETWAEVLEGKL